MMLFKVWNCLITSVQIYWASHSCPFGWPLLILKVTEEFASKKVIFYSSECELTESFLCFCTTLLSLFLHLFLWRCLLFSLGTVFGVMCSPFQFILLVFSRRSITDYTLDVSMRSIHTFVFCYCFFTHLVVSNISQQQFVF